MTKLILKKWWFWLIAFFVFVFVLGIFAPKSQVESPVLKSQVKEIKPPSSAAFPKQKYFEESIVADGKNNTFTLQHTYGDLAVRLNDEIQAVGVKGDKKADVIFLDVISGSEIASKKLQFKDTPPENSTIIVTGAVFDTKSSKPSKTPAPTSVSTQAPTPAPTQQNQTWQRIHYWEGSGEKELETITIGNRKLALKRSWTNGPEPVYDDPDDVSPVQAYGVFQCEMNQQYEECALINQAFIGVSDEFTYYIQEIPSEILVRDRPMLLKVSAEKQTNWTVEILELK